MLWGVSGIIISTVLAWLSGFHANGLLQFGPLPVNDFYIYLIEHIIVWILPSFLFFIIGSIFSKSRIRVVDVFGTVAFAQLPFIGMNVLLFATPMQKLRQSTITEIVNMANSFTFILFLLLVMVFIVWVLVWLFQALKVSCNLKGAKLVSGYVIAILASDILSRIIIPLILNAVIATSVASETTPVPVTYVEDQYTETARQLTENYNNGRFEDIYIMFDSQMQKGLSKNKTLTLFSGVKKSSGNITGWEVIKSNQAYTVYKVKLKNPPNLQIAINQQSEICGLYIIP